MKALVVDPSKLFQHMIAGVFESAGGEAVAVDTGADALQRFPKSNFDIACVSLHLPDMSGIEFCRQLRLIAGRQHLPVILLTASEDMAILTNSLELGVTEAFKKAEMQKFAEYVQELSERRQQNKRQLTGCVLLVEDSLTVRMIVNNILEDMGLEVSQATDAKQAWKLFLQNDYDLVLTDVVLAEGTTGLELVRHIRRVEGKKNGVPILTMSGFSDAARKIELLQEGANDFIGKPILPEELVVRVRNLLLNKQLFDKIEVQQTHLQSLVTELQGTNDHLQREIDQRERVEMELRLAQKLEAVGRLASGIAHEINTPIQYIGDSVHFLKTAFEDLQALLDRYREGCEALARQPDQAAMLAAIREAEEVADLDYLRENVPPALERTLTGIDHVAGIVRAMKEFAHPDQRNKTLADLNQALLNTLVVARNEYKYVADVETDLGELPPVSCYPSDLNQVFLNLIVNAAHAIAEVVGSAPQRGRITVTTRRLDGDRVEIAVADTGGGIPDTIRDRVYDPFFTTKPIGQGTGQGLAIARSIVVDKHQGALQFDSAPGQGTTFYIRLPVS